MKYQAQRETRQGLAASSRRALLLACLAGSLGACGLPDPQPPAALSQSQAGLVVLRAFEAHGGWANWFRSLTSEYLWERRLAGPDSTPEYWRVKLDLHGARIRLDAQAGGLTQAWDGKEAWVEPPDAQLVLPPRFTLRTEHYWFSLPWKLADEGVQLELLDDEVRDGVNYRRVRARYPASSGDSPNDWFIYYFNADTGLLEKAVFIVTAFPPDPATGTYPVYYGEWRDYVDAGGLKVASLRRFSAWNDGQPGPFGFINNLHTVEMSNLPYPNTTFIHLPRP